MSTVMFDSANPATLPPWDGEFAVAGYVDGYSDFPAIRAMYPRARVMSITGHGGIAECADIEDYLMRDEDAPGWYRRARARGVALPKLYRQASSAAGLIQVMYQAGITRSEYRLWTAHYESQPHLCSPGTCGYPQGDATQWTSGALGRSLDQSLLTDSFFGAQGPPPPTYTEFDMAKLPVLQQGATDRPGGFWAVRRLQSLVALTGRINSIPAAVISVDGVFGASTAAGVKAVQAHAGIAVDGVCGSQTWSVLLTGSPG